MSRGFKGIRCPHCGEIDTLAARVDDVHTLVCRDCSEDVTTEDLTATVATIQRFIKWLGTAPATED